MVRLDYRRQHMAMAAIALLALTVPRLITAAPLDLLADGQRTDGEQEPGANFPGSAFFFVQGMFDRLPVQPHSGGHVLRLDEGQGAPAAVFRGATALDSYRALNCLTSAIYYEAGNEPEEGQRAVAQVVLNRVRSPLWPHSVCAVVYQGSERTDNRCQFTFSCDGSMARAGNGAAWTRARRVAADALSGRVYTPVGLATFYHTLAVRPGWAASKRAVAVIGAHIFYSSPGFHGTTAAFRIPYAGREWQSGPSRRPWPAQAGQQQSILGAPAIARTPVLPNPRSSDTPGGDSLPLSTIRPEYRNSGRPLI